MDGPAETACCGKSSKLEKTRSRRTRKMLEDYVPNQASDPLLINVRQLHAFKVGVGVLAASLTVLIPSWDTALKGTGPWAVITTIIVTLQTPGETANKVFHRFIGTVVGAMLAITVGLLGRELEQHVSPLGDIVVGASNAIVASWGAWLYTKGDSFTYAFFLGTITYCFLVLGTLAGDAVFAAFRVGMIGLGGAISFTVTWLPPHYHSYEVARSYLVDSMLDMSVCVEALIRHYLAGDVLTTVEDIYLGESDDVVHRCGYAIRHNRAAFEAAITSASWEKFGDMHTSGFHSCGRAVRCTLRSLLAADLIIRRTYKPMNPTIESEQRLKLALQEIARAISSELGQSLVLLKWEVPARINVNADPKLTLQDAMTTLKVALKMYMESKSSTVAEKINHIVFAKLMYDTGLMALEISPCLKPVELNQSNEDQNSMVEDQANDKEIIAACDLSPPVVIYTGMMYACDGSLDSLSINL
jgi:hypothetical protein